MYYERLMQVTGLTKQAGIMDVISSIPGIGSAVSISRNLYNGWDRNKSFGDNLDSSISGAIKGSIGLDNNWRPYISKSVTPTTIRQATTGAMNIISGLPMGAPIASARNLYNGWDRNKSFGDNLDSSISGAVKGFIGLDNNWRPYAARPFTQNQQQNHTRSQTVGTAGASNAGQRGQTQRPANPMQQPAAAQAPSPAAAQAPRTAGTQAPRTAGTQARRPLLANTNYHDPGRWNNTSRPTGRQGY